MLGYNLFDGVPSQDLLPSIFHIAFPGCFKFTDCKKGGYHCGHKHFGRNEPVLACADWSQETIKDRGLRLG
jgi:hypothetical protein